MPNQRSRNKKLIGAQASKELWDGVDAWLSVNRGRSVTDFVLLAAIEKLERDGIKIDREAALRDMRFRYPLNGPRGFALNEANSKVASALEVGAKLALEEVQRRHPKSPPSSSTGAPNDHKRAPTGGTGRRLNKKPVTPV